MGNSILDQKKILIVDDEVDVLNVLEEEIRSNSSNCIVDRATNYDEASQLIQSKNYDLIVLDIMGVRGFELLDVAVKKNLKVVIITANALRPEYLKQARDMGARSYLPKQKLGEITPFLEDALKLNFEPGWKRLYEALSDVFTTLWGLDWEKFEKDVGRKYPGESGT